MNKMVLEKIFSIIQKYCDRLSKFIKNNKNTVFIFASIASIFIAIILSYLNEDGFMLLPAAIIPIFCITIFYNIFTASKNYKKAMAYSFIISALFQIYLAAQFIGVEHDINVQYNAAVVFERNGDVYSEVNPYYSTPIYKKITAFYRPDKQSTANIIDYYGHPSRIYLSYFAYKISKLTNLPFSFLVKIPMIISTLLIAFMIYKILMLSKMSYRGIYLALAFYLFNPVVIMVSGYHGQVDNLGIFFLILFLFYILKRKKTNLFLDLIFGCSLVLKPVTAATIPYFLLQRKKFARMLKFLIAASIPFLFLLIFYKHINFHNTLKFVILYNGVNYLWSYSRIEQYLTTLLNLPALHGAFKYVYPAITILMFSIIFYYFYRNSKIKPLDGIILSYLFFYSLNSGFGVQYLLWILPFAVIKATESNQFRYFLFVFSFLSGFLCLIFYYGNANRYFFMRDVIGYSIMGISLWLFIIYWLLWYINIGVKIKATQKPIA